MQGGRPTITPTAEKFNRTRMHHRELFAQHIFVLFPTTCAAVREGVPVVHWMGNVTNLCPKLLC